MLFIYSSSMQAYSWEWIKQKWSDFRISKNHKHLPESSLIADKSSTAMFNLAGMQQLIPYFSGKKHPLGKRLFNIQKCVRTVDIDEVGDDTHLTMFEMMGNRSLGDYFKKESIQRSREFLTSKDRLWLDPNKLAITVFAGDSNAPRDEESAKDREEAGAQKISYLWADDNRRSPGPIGPCGPDTEIFYRVGEGEFPPADSDVASDPENWMEIRNNVFMQYYRDDTWNLTKLSTQSVDTWMWFERMAMVLQDKTSPYHTDIFHPAIQSVEKALAVSYDKHPKHTRIIADHCRTSLSLIAENIQPSNEGRGYVLRMIIRRMYYNIVLLNDAVDMWPLAEQLTSFFGFTENHKTILLKEITQFQKTLQNGQKEFEKILHATTDRTITGKDVFKLYDTFGFPYELTKELAQEKWLTIDEASFHKALEEQKNRSRQATKGKFSIDIDRSTHIQDLPETIFVGYDSLEDETPTLLKDFEVKNHRILIFDRTPFYAEWWWQTGDRGVVILDSWEELTVQDVKKYEWVFLHFVA